MRNASAAHLITVPGRICRRAEDGRSARDVPHSDDNSDCQAAGVFCQDRGGDCHDGLRQKIADESS